VVLGGFGGMGYVILMGKQRFSVGCAVSVDVVLAPVLQLRMADARQ
jgi:hypothetical protein